MAELKERVLAEFENIDRIIDEINQCATLSELSTLELAGVGSLLHNFLLRVSSLRRILPEGTSSVV